MNAQSKGRRTWKRVDAPTLNEAIRNIGLIPPEEIAIKEITRFAAFGKPPGNKSAWVFLVETQTFAVFGDWTTDEQWSWRMSSNSGLSRREQEATEREADDAYQRAKEERQQEQEAKKARAFAFWAESTEVEPSNTQTYLTGRGITITPPDSLRFHPNLYHAPTNTHFPCMVAQITDSATGEPLGIHRTYLAQDGKGKAPVDSAKMMLGSSKGGVVRLGEPGDDGVLMIGEGIETCLSAMQAIGHPAWAALSTSGYRTIAPPMELQKIYILADNDESGAGEEAARELAKRLIEEEDQTQLPTGSRQIFIAMPPEVNDFNDLLRSTGSPHEGEKLISQVIENAEEIHDPIFNLFEQAEKDSGYLSKPEVIARIGKLADEERHRIRAEIKTNKDILYTLKDFDKSIAQYRQESEAHGSKEILTKIVLAAEKDGEIEFFRAANNRDEAYINVMIPNRSEDKEHRETWTPSSQSLRQWLTRRYFENTGEAINAEPLNAVINWITATAKNSDFKYRVFIRIGAFEGRYYLDLCDESWHSAEIDSEGWGIVNIAPVCFIRQDGMEEIPEPVRPENSAASKAAIQKLRSCLNVTDNEFMLALSWLLGAFRETGPYPLLVLSGEQGTAKSTFSRLMRKLIDPNSAPLRRLPKDDRDLFIAAKNSRILAFDNLSRLSEWISDALASVATEGGFATRMLYSDDDEVLIKVSRPIILNGITNIAERSDLADRSIVITLNVIPPKDRRDEKELMNEFEEHTPSILGALLDVIVVGLKRLPEIKLSELPRMADFARWVVACESALGWEPGTFLEAYMGNRRAAVDNVLDADPVASALLAFMEAYSDDVWEGTSSKLLQELTPQVDEGTAKSRSWPNSSQLSKRLLSLNAALREVGIQVERVARTSQQRMLKIIKIPGPMAASEPSVGPLKTALKSTNDGMTGVTGNALPSVYGGKEHTPAIFHASVSPTDGKFPSSPSSANGVSYNPLVSKDKSSKIGMTGHEEPPVTMTGRPVISSDEFGATQAGDSETRYFVTNHDGTWAQNDRTPNSPVIADVPESDEPLPIKCGCCANFTHTYNSPHGRCEKDEPQPLQGIDENEGRPQCAYFSWRKCGSCFHYRRAQHEESGYCSRARNPEPAGGRPMGFHPGMCPDYLPITERRQKLLDSSHQAP